MIPCRLLDPVRLYYLYVLLSGIVNGVLCSTCASVVIRDHPVTVVNHPDIPLLEHTFVIVIADIHNEISLPEQVIVLTLPFIIPAPGETWPRRSGDQMQGWILFFPF